jgi:hypothetical protein
VAGTSAALAVSAVEPEPDEAFSAANCSFSASI